MSVVVGAAAVDNVAGKGRIAGEDGSLSGIHIAFSQTAMLLLTASAAHRLAFAQRLFQGDPTSPAFSVSPPSPPRGSVLARSSHSGLTFPHPPSIPRTGTAERHHVATAISPGFGLSLRRCGIGSLAPTV